MAIYVGARVRSVTIEPDWDDGPERHADIQAEWPVGKFTNQELQEKLVLVALAGPVAEMLHTGEPYHPGFVAEWAADWKLAWEAAVRIRAGGPPATAVPTAIPCETPQRPMGISGRTVHAVSHRRLIAWKSETMAQITWRHVAIAGYLPTG